MAYKNKHWLCAQGSVGQLQPSKARLQASGSSCGLDSGLLHVSLIPGPHNLGHAPVHDGGWEVC